MNKSYKSNWPIVANNHISQYLNTSIKSNKIGGAYIFAGPDNLGKTTIAKFFAQIILCQNMTKSDDEVLPCDACPSCQKFSFIGNSEDTELEQSDLSDVHGDFHIVNKNKDKKNISIKQVRELIAILQLSSFNGAYKIGIIKNADSMSIEAANALLKTLEEPQSKTVIILVTKDLDSLPATIASRSQVLQFKPVKTELIYDHLVDIRHVSREKARDIASLCLGRPALAIKFLEDADFYDFYTTKVEAILDMQTTDINGRFEIINSLISKKIKGQEAVKIAKRTLEIWQGVIRDFLLLSLGHNNMVQHIYVRDRLMKQANINNILKFINLSKELASAHMFLQANVNPRLVFERIALSI